MTSDSGRRARRLGVVTVSDRCFRGEQEDAGGPLVIERLRTLPTVLVCRSTVPDEEGLIRGAALAACGVADLIVLTGGTGLGARDVTPQALDGILDYEVPGMAEAMRSRGFSSTPHAMLSRQLAGVRNRCLVIALPGSVRAVGDCLDAIWAALPHALALLSGENDHHQAPSVPR